MPKVRSRKELRRDVYEHTDSLPGAYILVRDRDGQVIGHHIFPTTIKSIRRILEVCEDEASHPGPLTVEVGVSARIGEGIDIYGQKIKEPTDA